MIIKSLELADFRNYESLEISFDKGTNIFYGDNAQGKTNILEAIYVSATTKSHKGSKDKEIIQFNKSEAHIRTYLLKDEDGPFECCSFFAGGSRHYKERACREKTLCGYGVMSARQLLSL